MTARGGARQGAGRKKGSATRRTQEIVAKATAEGESPLEYMLRVMRESNDDKRKDAMAIAAAPFVHPKLAAVEHSTDPEKPMTMQIVSGVPRQEQQEPHVNGHDTAH